MAMARKPDWDFAFRIRGTTPQTLPLARLAEYMREFAEFLGNRNNVHFGGLVKGSAVLRANVDDPIRTEVTKRILGTRTKDAPQEAIERAAKIDRMLREDRTRGEIIRRDGNILYAFEGAKSPEPEYDEITVAQEGELTGIVVRIGGKDETVPLTLECGEAQFEELTIKGRELARAIATHLFGPPIRVYGHGSWTRGTDGQWSLTKFYVQSFAELDQSTLSEIVADLRTVRQNGWENVEDPIETWHRMRGE